MIAPATYNDGRTAETRPVTIAVDGGFLCIRGDQDGTVERWPLADVRYVDRPARVRPVRLRCGFDRDDRLTLADGDDGTWLAAHCPNLTRTMPGWRRTWRPLALWGGGAVVSVVLLLTVGIPMMAERIAFALPASFERQLGDETAKQVIRYLAAFEGKKNATNLVCTRAAGQAAIDRLAARLAAGLGQPVALHLRVVDLDMVNAVTLPGGNILVFRGLTDFAENGDELAGVLAHEIGHVVRRHATAVTIRQAGTSLIIGLLVGDVGGGAAISGLGEMLLGTGYSRAAEREADALGIDLMNAAGFDGKRFAAFLQRMGKKEGNVPAAFAFLSTHPTSAERQRIIRDRARGTAAALGDADWRAIRSMCPRPAPDS